MPDPALPSLLSRVEAATGADRELSEAIHRVIDPELADSAADPLSVKWAVKGCPDLTASVDAVLALIERELPGWVGSIHQRDPLMAGPDETSAWGAVLASPEIRGGPEPWSEDRAVAVGEGATPALAALAALIRAKIAQTEEAHA